MASAGLGLALAGPSSAAVSGTVDCVTQAGSTVSFTVLTLEQLDVTLTNCGSVQTSNGAAKSLNVVYYNTGGSYTGSLRSLDQPNESLSLLPSGWNADPQTAGLTSLALVAPSTPAAASTYLTVTKSGLAAVSIQVTVQGAPAAPSGLAATAGNQQLSVAFTPGSDGGSAITRYEYSLDSGAWTSASSTQSPVVITGLTNETTYSVKLRAVNANGNGAESTAVVGTPTAVAPMAPSGLTATAGSGQLSISFTAGSDGGSAVTGYDYAVDGGSGFGAWTSAGSTQSPVVITGLTNGTTYSVKLRAVNAIGDGAESSATTGTPVAAQPDPDPAPAPAPAPTASPSSSPRPAAPVSTPQANLAPEPVTRPVTAGQAGVTVGGRPAQVVVSELPVQLPVTSRGSAGAAAANRTLVPNGVAVTGGGVEVKASGPTIAGTRQATGLTVPQAGPVSLGAAGFAAGTPVNVYLVVPGREPVLLQSIQADGRGAVSTTFAVSENTPQGAAVIQIVGTNSSNERMNVNVGMNIESRVVPQTVASGALPRVRAGAAVALGPNGRPLPDSQAQVSGGVARLKGGAVSMTIRDASDPSAGGENSESGLSSTEGGYVRVTGSGLAPNSSASVWGFSTPVLVGVVYANAEGSYNATFPIPEALHPGKHTLQIVASSTTGEQISLATGLTITAKAVGGASRTATSRQVVDFDRLSSTVSTEERKQLRRFVREVGAENIVRADVVGFVQEGYNSSNDSRLSRARAESVSRLLRELGVEGPIRTSGVGVRKGPSDQARIARVSMQYVK